MHSESHILGRLRDEETGRRAARREEFARRKGQAPGRSGWFSRQRPVLRFVVLFALCMMGFYGLTATQTFEQWGWAPYLELNARVSAAILKALGEEVTVTGRSITAARAALVIERGCDAIHPSLLFVSAVLAVPAPWVRKLWGILAGIAVLALTNLARIVTLFYVQVFYPVAFEVVHIEVWQALFIGWTMALWVSWALWAVRGPARLSHASS